MTNTRTNIAMLVLSVGSVFVAVLVLAAQVCNRAVDPYAMNLFDPFALFLLALLAVERGVPLACVVSLFAFVVAAVTRRRFVDIARWCLIAPPVIVTIYAVFLAMQPGSTHGICRPI